MLRSTYALRAISTDCCGRWTGLCLTASSQPSVYQPPTRDKLTDLLIRRTLADDGVLVHLSTGEYEHLFDWRRLCRELRVVQPMFMVDSGGELAVQAVWAKACRGAMTRWLLEQQPTSVEALHEFGYEGFAWRPQLGEPAIPYFVREG